MKKIKTMLCLVLTILISFSLFGCFESCWTSCYVVIKKNSIKLGKEEAEKQKMVLDSLQKQVDGYKLIVDYSDKGYETENDDWVKLEDCEWYDFGIYHGTYNGNAAVGIISEEGEDTICLQVEEEGKVVEKTIDLDYSIVFAKYNAIESFQAGEGRMHLYCCDGAWFLIALDVKPFSFSRKSYYMAQLDVPPVFYLLDFENNTMYYAGYADGWYKNAAERYYMGGLVYSSFNIVMVIKA
ncbi:MAG: hypothetical protein IKT32_05210 [Clostridia bacterium]|nr:hypothetical protein [Clostridia bacterium]